MTRVLVVGGGGREHALVRALARSPQEPEILCTPGNAGIAADGVRCLDAAAEDAEGILRAAVDDRCDLVVIGPEAPLVNGVVDKLANEGIAAFGPSGAAAQLEGSKVHAKEVMQAAGVPTAPHTVLRDREEALAHLPCASYPAVLKADRLAAGKGVVICQTEAEAREAVELFFTQRRFGETTVVLESFLNGEEVSLLALCDGERALPMAPARDFKRIFDGDEGANTGGMGSFSPVPEIDEERAGELAREVHQPIVDELRRRGTPFHGVLYAGLMMTSDGPKVLEYNCRFGDPETQAVLPRLESDLLDLLQRATRPGGLEGAELRFSSDVTVAVVLASGGYPEGSSSGDAISGLEEAAELPGVEVLHAGTAAEDGEVVTAGGRVLAVVGRGGSVGEARARAYQAADRIDFQGRQLRRDIALAAERVEA